MKKNTLFIFLFACILFFGCSTSKNVVTPKQTFTFDYKTPTISKAGSSKILVAFIKPFYAESFRNLGNTNDLFYRFRESIGDDIAELLIDKGFRIKGTYGSFDEMIFESRKTTDLAISIEISPSFSAQEGGWKAKRLFQLNTYLPPKYEYSYSGTASLVGKITCKGFEPLTHEIIWTKSVDIPSISNINITTANSYSKILNNFELLNDQNVYNAIGKALRDQYNGIMQKIDTYIEPEELNSLKGDIKELKSKKGY